MSKRTILAAGAAALAVTAAGGAIAATKLTAPEQERKAIIDDAAAQLGVSPEKLDAALQKALENRIDKAVADGRLTRDEAERLKARIESGAFPFFAAPGLGPRPGGFGHGFGFGIRIHHGPGPFRHGLDAAASYLGLSEAQLRQELRGGKSLAAVANEKGKTVDGLVDAMLKDTEKKLDQAVADGRLTKDEKQELLKGLDARTTDLVNGRFPLPPDWHDFRRGGRLFRLHR